LFGLKNIIIFADVKHMLKAPRAEGWAYTYILKGVTVRFGFDALRTSQIPNEMSKTKQRERPLGCFYQIHPVVIIWVAFVTLV